MYDYIVVGAGLAGAVSARVLAEKGFRVLIIEQHSHIAGHCHDFKNEDGITVSTYGPHIFHTDSKKVWDWVCRFTSFRYYQHRVLSYADGQLLPFPINRDTITKLFGVDLSITEVKSFLEEEVKGSRIKTPPENFRDAVISQVGENLYKTFFEKYTIKQWERNPSELSPELARRIPVRYNRDNRYFTDKYQGIPTRGFSGMVERILDHELISLQLNTDYFSVKDQLDPKLTIYTGELDRFFDYEFGKLQYRSLSLEFRTLELESPFYQSAAVVNYPNDYDWTRITEFKHLTGERSKKTTICFEYPLSEGEPYYIVPDKENSGKRVRYMEKVKELEKSGAYLFIGRLAEYTYYNMDQVIAAVLKKMSSAVQ
ncbi:MAG: UDP-galactopyranose mutase [Spirochaetales bacterium]|jgi:UDP-galactopyranose mutase|nr:UDP-galactopyranose mutase [Spirochaetales bacterium]